MFDSTARPTSDLNANQIGELELSDKSRTCIARLLQHLDSERNIASKAYNSVLLAQPITKLASVLVLLYEDQGRLRILLTTRSKALRTHAGQTALPGGRVDLEDRDFVATALREAKEEVSLPSESPEIRVLGTLQPFLSLHRLFVVPVIALLTKPSILRELKGSEKEVAHIFSYPLEAILDPSMASLSETLAPMGSDDWIYQTEHYNTSDSVVPMLGNTSYRMHRFRTSASPIKGLTSDILIQTAEATFGRPPVYGRYAADQLRRAVDIVSAVKAFETQSATILNSAPGALTAGYTQDYAQ